MESKRHLSWQKNAYTVSPSFNEYSGWKTRKFWQKRICVKHSRTQIPIFFDVVIVLVVQCVKLSLISSFYISHLSNLLFLLFINILIRDRISFFTYKTWMKVFFLSCKYQVQENFNFDIKWQKWDCEHLSWFCWVILS